MRAPDPSLRPSTICIHAGTYIDEQTGGACSPVFTSTAYAFPNPANENFYPRYFNTPDQRVIEQKIAALEGGESALLFGSGMAAITTLLFAHLKPGGSRRLPSRPLRRHLPVRPETPAVRGRHLPCPDRRGVCHQPPAGDPGRLRRVPVKPPSPNR